jgi:hypothetical protein
VRAGRIEIDTGVCEIDRQHPDRLRPVHGHELHASRARRFGQLAQRVPEADDVVDMRKHEDPGARPDLAHVKLDEV